MVSQGRKVRRGVIIASSIMLVLQLIAFMGTAAFYWFASSEGTRYYLSKAVFTALYHQKDWHWLKREHALELHTLIAGSIQLLLLPATILLLIGATTRTRWLLLPWLTLFALFQLCVLFSILACVLWLPKNYKLLAAGVATVEAFILFPWWFASLHLFSMLTNMHLLDKDSVRNLIFILLFYLSSLTQREAERIYNLNAEELTSALEAYSNSRRGSQFSRKASIIPYEGSEMIVPIMMHSNAGTLRRDHQLDGRSYPPHHHHCCTCDKASYSTMGRGSSYHTKYSEIE